MQGFIDFIREQGVVGLAIGFVLGAGVTRLVNSLVEDIINPLLGPLLGAAGALTDMSLQLGTIEVRWGQFLSTLIDFVILAAVVYFIFKGLRLDKADKAKK